jgi:hypothetical protein
MASAAYRFCLSVGRLTFLAPKIGFQMLTCVHAAALTLREEQNSLIVAKGAKPSVRHLKEVGDFFMRSECLSMEKLV